MFLNHVAALSVMLLSHGGAKKSHTTHKHTGKAIHHKVTRVKHHPQISQPVTVDTGDTSPEELLDFAKSNIGMPYRFGSSNPNYGFDCSGFVTYIFNHFDIKVPRGSADYDGVQQSVPLEDARPGDLILFTGTKSHHRHSIGHMGIVIKGYSDTLQFIHSSSGDAHRVTLSPLNAKYMARLVKVVRVFQQDSGETTTAVTADIAK